MFGIGANETDGIGGTGQDLETPVLDGFQVGIANSQDLRNVAQIFTTPQSRSTQKRAYAGTVLMLGAVGGLWGKLPCLHHFQETFNSQSSISVSLAIPPLETTNRNDSSIGPVRPTTPFSKGGSYFGELLRIFKKETSKT